MSLGCGVQGLHLPDGEVIEEPVLVAHGSSAVEGLVVAPLMCTGSSDDRGLSSRSYQATRGGIMS